MATVEQVVAPLVSRGILRKFPPESADRYAPAHPCLVARIEDFAASDVSAAHDIRRTLRRRILADGRLSLPEIRRVRRYLGGDLASDEATTLKRSIRRSAVQIGSSITLLLAVSPSSLRCAPPTLWPSSPRATSPAAGSSCYGDVPRLPSCTSFRPIPATVR